MINKPKISLMLIGLLAVIGLTITAGSATPSAQVCAEGKTNCPSQSTESIVVMQGKMHKEPGKLLLVKVSSFDKGVLRGTIVEPKDAVSGPMPEGHNPLMIRPEDVIALNSKGEFTFNLPPKPDFKHEMFNGNCAIMMKGQMDGKSMNPEDCMIMMKDMQNKMQMDCPSGECGKGELKVYCKDKMTVGVASDKACAGNCKTDQACESKCKDIKACDGNCKMIMIGKDGKNCIGKEEIEITVIKEGKTFKIYTAKPEKGKNYRIENKDGKKVYVQEIKLDKGEDCQIIVDGKPIKISKDGKPGEECKVITNKDGKTITLYMSKPEKDKNYRIESKDGKKVYVKEIKIEKGDKDVMWFDGKEVPMGEKGKMMPPPAWPTCGQPMPPHGMMMSERMGGPKGPMMLGGPKGPMMGGMMMIMPDPKPGEVIALMVSEKDIQAALTGSLTTFNVLGLMPPAMDPNHMKMMFMKDKEDKIHENCNKECEQPCK